MLTKAARSQHARPSVPIMPLLVARRMHVTTFRMLKDLGAFAIETKRQYIGAVEGGAERLTGSPHRSRLLRPHPGHRRRPDHPTAHPRDPTQRSPRLGGLGPSPRPTSNWSNSSPRCALRAASSNAPNLSTESASESRQLAGTTAAGDRTTSQPAAAPGSGRTRVTYAARDRRTISLRDSGRCSWQSAAALVGCRHDGRSIHRAVRAGRHR